MHLRQNHPPLDFEVPRLKPFKPIGKSGTVDIYLTEEFDLDSEDREKSISNDVILCLKVT